MLVAAASLLAAPASAQLTLSNLIEAQSGRDPFRSDLPKNRLNVYEQLNLEYRYEPLTFGARFEANRGSTATPDAPGYQVFTQRWAEWSDRALRVRVGNFQTILGRGLIHRSFELPGVILDQSIFPSRYVLTRDVDGVLAEAEAGSFSGRAFSGRPNGGEFSPAVDGLDLGYERYTGLVSGGQLGARIHPGVSAGAAYLRYSSPTAVQSEFGSGFAEIDPARLLGIDAFQLPLYFEYARKRPALDDWLRFSVSTRDTAALYAAGNLLWGPVTFAAEWKDYRAFNLGTNAPPSLVREHSFSLLNRNTHFLVLSGERGFQLEGSYAAPAWVTLTANLSRADGRVGSRLNPKAVRFEERYAEVHVAPPGAPGWDGTLFVQDGRDEFVSLEERRVLGGAVTIPAPFGLSVSLDLEGLEATRAGFRATDPRTRIVERVVAVSVARAKWGSASLVYDRTNDPVDEDPDEALDQSHVQPNTFLAVILAARLSDRQDVKLFAGERRRGLACTAGTCYVVEPFKGVELRLTTRL